MGRIKIFYERSADFMSSSEEDLFDYACTIFRALPQTQQIVAIKAMEYIRGNCSDVPPFLMRAQRCAVLL